MNNGKEEILLNEQTQKFDEINKNLRCCGNCMSRSSIDMGNYCEEACTQNDSNLASAEVCECWIFDGLTASERRGK